MILSARDGSPDFLQIAMLDYLPKLIDRYSLFKEGDVIINYYY